SRHRAIELEEAGVAHERLTEDTASFGIAFTAQDVGIALRFGPDLDHLTIRDGAATLAFLVTAGADEFGFGQAFRLHALIGLLRDLGGQVGSADTHVRDRDAERFGVRPK